MQPVPSTQQNQASEQESSVAVDTAVFFKLSLDLLCVISKDGIFKQVNPAFNKTLGYANGELLEQKFIELVHPEDRAVTKAAIAQIQTSDQRTGYFENRYLCRDSSYKELGWTVRFEAETALVYAIARELTLIKSIKDTTLYRTLARNLPKAAVFLFDDNLRYELCEGQEIASMGFNQETLEGKTIWDVLPPKTCTEIEPLYRATLAGQELVTEMAFCGHAYAVQIVPVRNEQQEIVAGMMLLENIDERKQTEEALDQSEETVQRQLKEIEAIYTSAPVGLCFLDTNLRYVRVNDRLAEINGIPAAEHIGKSVEELLPEIGEVQAKLFAQVLQTRVPILDAEVRGTTPAQPGIERDWLVSYYPLRDINDRILGINIVVQEITQRKQQAAALAERETQLTTILSNTPDVICRYSKDFRYLYISPAAERITGIPTQQFIGKTNAEIGMPEIYTQNWENAIAEVLKTSEQQILEFNFPLASKTWYFYSIFIPEFAPDGSVESVLVVSRDVTERRQAEESLAKSQDWLQLSQQAGQIGAFVWDIVNGDIVWTQQLEILYGLTPGSFGGTYEHWRQQVHPEDIVRIEQSLQEKIQTRGEEWQGDFRIFHAQTGEIRWIAAKSRFFYDNFGQPIRMIGVNLDISDRKHTEVALRESELNYRMLADTMPQLFWTTLPDGYHEYYNQRWYDYTGLTLEETKGAGWNHVLHPDDQQRSWEVWHESLQTGKNYEIEYRFRRFDGEYRWFLGRAFPLHDDTGQIIRWFGSCTDIHDQKIALEERDRAVERERTARSQAEAANRIKDEFLAVLSHELRSPLNPILGWAKLLLTRQFDENTTRKALQTIERNAQLQTRLIEDLLDISRILRGKLSLNITQVNLVTIAEAALETVRLAAEEKAIHLQLIIEDSARYSEFQIAGDAARLQQIVWNLLTNAVKFTPHGGRVEVKLEKLASSSVQIQVSDTGKGIAPEFLPHVFDYFRQADSSITRKFGGLGLGLAIVRHLVELHGGTVKADSQGESKGATFSVTLPLPESKIVDENSGDRIHYNDSDLPLLGIRALIVDDEADMRELLVVTLEQYGAQVTAAASASEVLELPQYQILISDIGMPNVDGYTLMRQIRTLPPDQGGAILAIALTAYAGETDQQAAIAAGFNRHLAKPVEPAKLLATIVNLLSKKS
ncbi:PAS domain S-box protein [Gloeocapsa sp. BRSZ]